ncbi:glycosyl hydrolase [Anaerophaga thermohalophila]|uniref:glycosyl hydrolase n=1 Tax=Anaerophaga thermohalophila TaxID=177400 RepID=UPI000237C8CB|nr:glycosyl hydrolase [Anaerophaga thermohalophila]
MTKTNLTTTSIILVSLIVNSFTFGQVDNRNFKRGYGFGNHTQADMEALSAGTTWWYNWWYRPDATDNIINVYQDYGMEFVPQAWNANFDEAGLRQYLNEHPDVKYIMGFNEPNFKAQANLTPAQAAAEWHKIEAIAEDYNLKIVGPALNYSPDAPYYDPFQWMDEFLEECDALGGCHFDYVNVHSYMNNVDALRWYLNEWKKYGKPIWLTEFCAWDGIETTVTPEYQQNFMIEALELLDNDPDVYRYAWFTAKSTGIPYNSLLGTTPGELTTLGLIYTDQYTIPQSDYITIRVIDKTKGEVTNSAVWPDQSVYTWLGNTTTWVGLNNMPPGTMEGNWIGMYSGVEGGNLEKNEEEWIWSYTFIPTKGLTYNWNPGIWIDEARTENSLQNIHVGRNLEFTVDNEGVATGELTLVIEDANNATPVESTSATGINEKSRFNKVTNIAPNPANDRVFIFSPFQIKHVQIYNLTGELEISQDTNGSVFVGQLSSGQYIMKITGSQNEQAIKKLIIK